MKIKIFGVIPVVIALLCGAARFAEAFDVRFINDFDKKMSVVVAYFDADAQKWRTRGWYLVEPHSTKKVTLKASKTTAYIYAELAGKGTTWGNGDISRTVINQAFSYFDGQDCPQGSSRRTIKLTKYTVNNGAIDFKPKTATADAPLKTAGDAPAEPKQAATTLKPTRPLNDPDLSLELRKVTDKMISLVNKERRSAGVKPVIRDETLCKAAQRRAWEIHSNFSHTRPGGQQAITVLKEYGIGVKSFDENLEKDNAASLAYANEAFYKSPDHRATMLNAKYTHIGAGLFVQDGVYYWTQLYSDKPTPVTPSELQDKNLEENIDDLIRSLNELGDLFK